MQVEIPYGVVDETGTLLTRQALEEALGKEKTVKIEGNVYPIERIQFVDTQPGQGKAIITLPDPVSAEALPPPGPAWLISRPERGG